MALLNIFKKKKPKKEPAPAKVMAGKKAVAGKEKKEEVKLIKKPKEIKKVEKPVEIATQKVKKEKVIGEAWKVLKSPHITEKATDLTKKNQYTFKVYQKANKVEIKKAIEDIYGVDVSDVKIINIHSKRRRLGKTRGWKTGYKKAIVKIKKGQNIEVLPR